MGGTEIYLTVLARELDRDAKALPLLGGLGDVIADLLGRLRRRERSEAVTKDRARGRIWVGYHAERADLGGKSGTTRYLTAGDTAVDCKTRRRSNGVQSRLAAARAVYDADSSTSRAY